MNDEQNQFYTSISKYYSEIFPYQPMQFQFVKSRAIELAGKQILDIGCATGELSFQMANAGAKVTGIDLNEDLLEQALSKTGCSDFRIAINFNRGLETSTPIPKFQIGNMLDLETDFQSGKFDVVLCFGNTLVHLQTLGLIQQMLNGVFTVLKPGSRFLLQILNYDFILGEQVSTLPTIETENIRFIRNYRFEENNPLIQFQTKLVMLKENKTISNETLLFALKSAELKE